MSQNDLSIANQGFASFRSDLNSALQALGSTNSGTSAPSTTYANQLFYDTTNNILKIRNEDNDAFISLFTLDQTNDNIESLTINGALTADSLAVDNITIDGTEIDLSSGDLTLDVAGDIILDADGGDVAFRDGGTGYLQISSVSNDVKILSLQTDKDIIFSGIDGGSEIEAMRIDMSSGGDLKIGTTSEPSHGTADSHFLAISGSQNTGSGTIGFIDTSGNSDAVLIADNGTFLINVDSSNATSSSFLQFRVDNTEAMRLNDDKTLLIGRSSVGSTGNGHSIRGGDSAIFSRDASGETMQVCRNDNNGELIRFKKNDATAGFIATEGGKLQLNSSIGSNLLLATDGITRIALDSIRLYPNTDNNYDLGISSNRFDDIFATNGTIQTSDQNEKQDIASATAKELNVAKKLSALFKTFKWKDKVTEKGDKARTHTGIVAQEVQLAFSAEGLDASNYGLFTSDTWWEKDNEIYQTKEEAPKDANEKTRLGVRYPELFSFIFSSIEARLTALESK